jgi:FkbM family methyltransferase
MNSDKQLLLSYFQRNDNLVIFDIGSCEAEDSIQYAQMFPNSKIYAFEPVKSNYHKCIENVNKAGLENRIKIFNCALSDKDGFQKIYLSSGCPDGLQNTDQHNYGNKSSSLLKPKEHLKVHEWCKFEKVDAVKTIRLDDFCKKYGIKHIDIAHIDTQGTELQILSSLSDVTIDAIYTEVSTVEMYEGQALQKEVSDFLKSKGMVKVFECYGGVQLDELWVKESLTK